MKIIPTHYTLSSAVGSTIHLRSWIIEASDDGENWIKIDEQNNCDFLDGCNLTHTFKINNHDSNQYSYIKIRQISENLIRMIV